MVRTAARRLPVAVALSAALLGACGGGSDVAAAPSAPSAPPVVTASPAAVPSPSPSPTRVDATTVPDDIDVAYVQAVMDELNRRDSEAYREVAASGEVGEAFYAVLKSTHTAADADRQISGFEDFVGPEGLADPPGDITTEVRELVHADADCIQALVVHDISAILSPDVDIEPEQPHTLKLLRRDPGELNPTPWAIDYLSWFDLEEPCRA